MPSFKQKGITAVELMVTLSIATVVIALSAPSLQQISLSAKLSSTANAIHHGLNQARTMAIQKNTPVTICSGTPMLGCQSNKQTNWSLGFFAFTDKNQDGILDTAERVLFTHTPSGGLVITGNTPMNKPIIFQPLGFAEQPGGAFSAGRVRVCAPKDFPGHAQDVVLLKSGMARVEATQFGGKCPPP